MTVLLKPGHMVGDYRIIDVIGDGGFSVVYKAEDTQLERLVAVKQLNPEAFVEYGTVERFKREARLAASLNHPHIVSTYAWKQEGDLLFLIMEYVSGGSVRQLINEYGFLAAGTVLKLAAHVCHALDALHSRGIVHRDIKPENILCTSEGEFKLADFGLAHNAFVEPRVQAVGPQSGTLMYMSPEQAVGKEVTARSDVYSLATVLYEALTGRYYLPVEDEEALTLAILEEAPPLPSAFNAALEPFDAPLARALRKNPDERQLSARAFYDELRNPAKRRRAIPPVPADLAAELRMIRILRDVLDEMDAATARLKAPWVADAEYPEVLAERGETLIALGQTKEGASLLRQAVALRPGMPFAQLALARLAQAANDLEAYGDAMVAAIRADADLVFADQYETLTAAIKEPEVFWMMIGFFQRAQDSSQPATYFNLGRAIALVQGYEREAITCFERALDLVPRMGSAYVALGGAYLSLGDVKQAITCFERATHLDFPTFPDDEWLKNTTAYGQAHAYLGLAMSYNHLGDTEASIKAALALLASAPADFELHADALLTAYIDKAAALIHKGDPQAAHDLLTRCAPLATNHTDRRVFAMLAHAQSQLERAR